MRLEKSEIELFAQERADYSEMMGRIERLKPTLTKPGIELVCVGNSGGADNIVHGRATGGFLLRYANRNILVDPGDNSLACLIDTGFDPYDLTDVLASHAHDDHVGDLSSAVMATLKLSTTEHTSNHIVVCPSLIDYATVKSTINGFTLPAFAWKGVVVPLYWKPIDVSGYNGHRVHSQSSIKISRDIEVRATEAHHGKIQVTGFVIDTPLGKIGYSSDSEYFETMPKEFEGCDLLWLNLNTLGLDATDDITPLEISPKPGYINKHLGYAGTCKLIESVHPSTVIVSHLGTQLLPYRKEVEQLLRSRFDELDISIHIPENGESFYFKDSLSVQSLQENAQQ